jgi:hypothetical protein
MGISRAALLLLPSPHIPRLVQPSKPTGSKTNIFYCGKAVVSTHAI